MRFIIIGAGIVIVFAGLKLAGEVLSPIIFATWLAILCLPIVRSMERKGWPRWAAMVLLIVSVVALFAALGAFGFLTIGQVRRRLPEYLVQVNMLAAQLQTVLDRFDIDLSNINGDMLDPGTVLRTATSVLGQTINGVIFGLLLVVGVIFMILESDRFGVKLRFGLGGDSPLVRQLAQFAGSMQQFFYLRTINNLIVAVGAGVFLVVMGIDFAVAWAVLIFFLSYIPNVGIILACVPAVVLALLQHGPITAIIVALGLTAINYIGDWAVTPRLMSQGLGLSQLTVFLSFFFWAYIFGAVGGLLSVPLTLLVKLLLEISDSTRWLAVLMDDKVPQPAAVAAGAPEALEGAAIVAADGRGHQAD